MADGSGATGGAAPAVSVLPGVASRQTRAAERAGEHSLLLDSERDASPYSCEVRDAMPVLGLG